MSVLKLTFIGLSLSSSWGNGHASTFRALLKGLHARGHELTFLERDVPWYRAHRDLDNPDYCRLVFYESLEDLKGRRDPWLTEADVIVVGSYVPEGREVIRHVLARAGGAVCFYDIDTPVTLAALENGGCAYLDEDLIAEFEIYFSFAGGPVLRRLEDRHGARKAVALYCMVDPAIYQPLKMEPDWDLGYLGTYSEDRQPALETLLLTPAWAMPSRRFVVAGPLYPDAIAWPANVERIEHVSPAEHAAFYSRLRYALNLTREDMRETGWAPSVRLFEAAACATPLISDRWLGLSDFFAEDTIRVADSASDVIAALQNQNEKKRRQMADAARDIVLLHHTGAVRAAQFEAAILGPGEGPIRVDEGRKGLVQ